MIKIIIKENQNKKPIKENDNLDDPGQETKQAFFKFVADFERRFQDEFKFGNHNDYSNDRWKINHVYYYKGSIEQFDSEKQRIQEDISSLFLDHNIQPGNCRDLSEWGKGQIASHPSFCLTGRNQLGQLYLIQSFYSSYKEFFNGQISKKGPIYLYIDLFLEEGSE